MSTKMSARGIVGSLRLVGVTAAVAAGIAGFSTIGAQAATDVSAAPEWKLADVTESQVPAKACQNMLRADVPAAVIVKHGCIVIPDEGEITGGSIFS